MKTKTVITVLSISAYLIFLKLFISFQGSLEGQIASKQLENDNFSYALSNALLSSDVNILATSLLLTVLLVTWAKTLNKIIKDKL